MHLICLGILILLYSYSHTIEQDCENCGCCVDKFCEEGIIEGVLRQEVCTKGCTAGIGGLKCYNTCPDDCVTCEHRTYNNCATCADHQYLSTDKRCLDCPARCKSCTSATRCQECYPPYYNNGKISDCSLSCPEHCICQTFATCSSCKAGYYNLSNACQNTCPGTCHSTQKQCEDKCSSSVTVTEIRTLIVINATVQVVIVITVIVVNTLLVKRWKKKHLLGYESHTNDTSYINTQLQTTSVDDVGVSVDDTGIEESEYEDIDEPIDRNHAEYDQVRKMNLLREYQGTSKDTSYVNTQSKTASIEAIDEYGNNDQLDQPEYERLDEQTDRQRHEYEQITPVNL